MTKRSPDDRIVVVPAAYANRGALVAALATMPDEAFSWFALACPRSAMPTGELEQIWPDRIGGFSSASKASIKAVRKAADEYLNQTG